jgi:hypothetical protein
MKKDISINSGLSKLFIFFAAQFCFEVEDDNKAHLPKHLIADIVLSIVQYVESSEQKMGQNQGCQMVPILSNQKAKFG